MMGWAAPAIGRSLGTPEALRDLAVSFIKVMELAGARQDGPAAFEALVAAYRAARAYRAKQPCPDADRMVSYLEDIMRQNGIDPASMG